MTKSSEKPSFLFVCTGNICRSPLAELAMREEARKRGLDLFIDSAGTGDWHLGYPPDPRAQAVAKREGLDISQLRARKVSTADFRKFSHIIALDKSHYKTLNRLKPAGSDAKVILLLDCVQGRKGQDVEDPYYGSDKDFDTSWHDVQEGCHALAEQTLSSISS
ncbi:low molecular weight protein-tyrosine-phosphatase [Aristophania vespae]|uniref:low molecular weight protein-tyrosine-phosphatase n=1 Tax=Aristophania vespae TaxID=2697033 RepID=UPI0023511E84|nr:low molecular weight protein-tyrosine-phosphatase [Aristophania vespae]UMM63663.1 Low molecular weight protein-tyrosine-phosphatase YfkJ [Aristophania vespae]